MPCDSSRKPQKPFRFIIPVAFVYCQHYWNYLLIRTHSGYFTICMLPRVLYYILNIYCYEKLNLFEKYLISERHSVIYRHDLKWLQLLCSRRWLQPASQLLDRTTLKIFSFQPSKNQSSWRQSVWFQEMTYATDTLLRRLEHTVHDVSNNRHAGLFVIPVHWKSLAWSWNSGLDYERNAAETPYNLVL
jgi:hypothetical protein